MPWFIPQKPSDDWPPAPECLHPHLDIDRYICPCGFRHVYCVTCETKMDTDLCPWIPDGVVFRAMMRHLWGGGAPADPAND